jgi:hypothetical protein
MKLREGMKSSVAVNLGRPSDSKGCDYGLDLLHMGLVGTALQKLHDYESGDNGQLAELRKPSDSRLMPSQYIHEDIRV